MNKVNWIPLTSVEQLPGIIERSKTRPQVIFKHSIRCGTSAMAKNRLERTDAPDSIDFYYLDLINYRDVSNKVSEEFFVEHESPQVLLIKDGECIYDESHIGIRMEELTDKAA